MTSHDQDLRQGGKAVSGFVQRCSPILTSRLTHIVFSADRCVSRWVISTCCILRRTYMSTPLLHTETNCHSLLLLTFMTDALQRDYDMVATRCLGKPL
ncbi:unnamed protein product [Ectocarpus sp. CCAP 1310/34]|nr:unnamed protein product [Ectocarpus sp. CCAP 1310/34]